MALVKRSDKVAFYGVKGAGSEEKFHRMSKFTDISVTKNSKEYARQYVDVSYEESDVVAYAPAITYGFDQYTENEVHSDIAKVHDEELLGSDAVRSIIIVDLSQEAEAGKFVARKREFSVIPDTEGAAAEAYTYTGTMKAKSETIVGYAQSSDEWKTCTFTEGTPATPAE